MAVKPKHFSEIFQDSTSLAKAISQVTNHELLACGKCDEPIKVLMEDSSSFMDRTVRFCTKCGMEIDWSKPEKQHRTCDECHISHDVEDLYCIHCGKPLKDDKKFSAEMITFAD